MVFHSMVHHPRYSRSGSDAFVSVQRMLDRALNDPCGASTYRAPHMPVRVDVTEDEKAFHVSADLPGLTDKEVDVTFDDGVLTLRGEKKMERDTKSEGDAKETWHIVERRSGSFERHIALPSDIDVDTIEAAFDKGVLTVTLPKSAAKASAATKITIKTN